MDIGVMSVKIQRQAMEQSTGQPSGRGCSLQETGTVINGKDMKYNDNIFNCNGVDSGL